VSFRISNTVVNWSNSAFLIGTALISLTVVPYHIWTVGLDWFQVGMFLVFFIATGLSITLGYHRLFSHKSFKATWPVRFLTLAFGAATFENHVLAWASDHRRHHKHVDHDDDPYDISNGFWHAHIGWILFKKLPEPPWTNVGDLRKDPLVMWQHNYYIAIALVVGFVIPTGLGWLHSGATGAWSGFLIAGVLRVFAVHHMTFFINSLCHTIGSQPYSSKCSAKDSGIMAIFTFGEGYHNYHHEFQHDYRNGVKWWQWDPTKWTIWTLSKLGMVEDLRRVDEDKAIAAQLTEAQRRMKAHLDGSMSRLSERSQVLLHASSARLDELLERWTELKDHYRHQMDELKHDYAEKTDEKWQEACHALEEMRREVRAAFELLDRLPAVA
jgi:stearoyl-CoA desaturase (delta-9 desaturase)